MKNGKRIICAALSLAMAASLCACGGNDTGYNKSSDTWTFTAWTNDSHSKATMEALVSKYNEGEGKEKGIKIDYQIQSSGEAVTMAIEADNAPDFFSAAVKKYSEMDKIIALDDMPGGPEYIKQYEGKLVEGTHMNEGKTYRVPFYVTTFGMVYNKDMFKKYGIVDENGEATPPKTYDQVRDYAKKLTHPENQEYGIMLPLKNKWFVDSDIEFVGMANQGYMNFNPETGATDYMGYKPIVDMYMGIKADKSYYPDPEGIDNDPGRAQFAEGNVGMKFAGSYDVGVYTDQFPAKCDWAVAPAPTAKEGVRYATRMASDGYLSINKKSAETKDKERLMEAFKWIHSEEVLTGLYKDGKSIPYDWNIVKDVDLGENAPTGWKEFCELVEVSVPSWRSPTATLTGQKNFNQVFIEDIWTEKVSVDDALADLTTRVGEARTKWLEENSDKYKLEDYIVENSLVPVN